MKIEKLLKTQYDDRARVHTNPGNPIKQLTLALITIVVR